MHARIDFLAQDLLGSTDGQRGHLLAQGLAGLNRRLFRLGTGRGEHPCTFFGRAGLGLLDDVLRSASASSAAVSVRDFASSASTR
jgi:hypothetical protein